MTERTSSERTSGDLEREAEAIRAGISQTAEALQDRMSPGKMVDEFMSYMKDSDGSLALDNLRRQARDNPMALAMIGSGFAWLMFGGGASSSERGAYRSATPYADETYPRRSTGMDAGAGATGMDTAGAGLPPTTAEPYPSDYEGWSNEDGTSSEGSGGSGLGSKVGGARDRASGLYDRAAGAASGAAGGARDRASGAYDRAAGAAGDAADRVRSAADRASESAQRSWRGATDRGYAAADEARDLAERGRRSLMDALDREPLVLGAIGVAVGAALGAMLPNTRFENETFGKTRDSLVKGAGDAVNRAAESARHVAGEALDAAKSASQDEGLVVEGKPVTDRAGNVAKAALSAGKDAAEREMKGSDANDPGTTGSGTTGSGTTGSGTTGSGTTGSGTTGSGLPPRM